LVIDASVWVAAADPADRFWTESREFITRAMGGRRKIYLPALARVEIACALSRRLRDPKRGHELAGMVFDIPAIREIALDTRLLADASRIGSEYFLRAADAIYLAVARKVSAELITWDNELIQRAGAVSPATRLSDRS